MIPDAIFTQSTFAIRTSAFLAYILLGFTAMQVFIAGSQSKWNRDNVKIMDLRNQLEKAYGPLYSLFNPYFWDYDVIFTPEVDPKEKLGININKSEKEKLNFILSNYPFMFKPEIFAYWREHLQYQRTHAQATHFNIDEDFIKMIYDEYYQRLEEYNNLLGKISARARLVESFV